MSLGIVVVLVVVTLLVLLATGVPVALSLAASGGLGLLLLESWSQTWTAFSRMPVTQVGRFTLVVVPLFVLMGVIAKHSGLAEKSFLALARLTRGYPSGLGLATVASCSMFAAICGSSVATVATIGTMSIREMRRYGYSDKLSAGIIGAAGTIGILIPPSIALILYGVIAEISIGPLLIAGIIPGVISAIAYGGFIVLRIRRHPELVGKSSARLEAAAAAMRQTSGSSATPTEAAAIPESVGALAGGEELSIDEGKRQEMLSIIRYGSAGAMIRIFLLAIIVIGGIYGGVFTATEASAVGAVGASLILIFDFRSNLRAMIDRFADALSETVRICSMAFLLLVGAGIFNFFLVVSRIPHRLSEWLGGLDVAPIVIVIIFLLVLIPLGMFLDGFSMMLIMVPLAHPIVTDLGFDGIWFAILFIKSIEVGLITPPLGLNIFVVAGADRALDLADVIRGVSWFIPIDFVVIALLVAFPILVTLGPSLMG